MKIYLASNFDLSETVEFISKNLESEGHTITVKWWSKDGFDMRDKKMNQNSNAFYEDKICRMIFERDFEGILEADAFVFVADFIPRKYNGANVEYGIAIGANKPCFSIGKLENSALYYPIIKCESLNDLITKLIS